MPIMWVFKTDVFVVEKGLFAIKSVENRVYFQFIFTIYDMGIQGATKGYRGSQGVLGVTRGSNGLEMVRRGYKGLQAVTGGYKGLQGVTKVDKALQVSYKGL